MIHAAILYIITYLLILLLYILFSLFSLLYAADMLRYYLLQIYYYTHIYSYYIILYIYIYCYILPSFPSCCSAFSAASKVSNVRLLLKAPRVTARKIVKRPRQQAPAAVRAPSNAAIEAHAEARRRRARARELQQCAHAALRCSSVPVPVRCGAMHAPASVPVVRAVRKTSSPVRR